MSRNSIVILGVPIDNLNLDETVKKIFSLIDDYKKESYPRLVATVNVDFLVNTLAWRAQTPRHPELLNILRYADLITPDGMPIVWAAKLLGTPLKERVTGADLTPKLAEECAKQEKSIYFLGGRGDIGKQAATKLQNLYPGLIVAGTDSPFINIDGKDLSEEELNDEHIVDKINSSKPDILLIAFGNPKQEIWFERNRKRLKVPVSIGIGGTFEFILGTVTRAPLWMQKSGTEWIFRITQQPKKLWKRYFVGFFKFGLMICPAILYYRYKRSTNSSANQLEPTENITSESTTSIDVKEISLPARIDATVTEHLMEETDTVFSNSYQIILNFSNVTFIDSSGLGFLLNIWRKVSNKKGELCFTGVNSSILKFFKLNRVQDLFEEKIVDSTEDTLTFFSKRKQVPRFYYTSDIKTQYVVFNLYGRLDATQMTEIDIRSIVRSIAKKNCILDLSNLTFVDSSGLVFFFRLQKEAATSNALFILCGMNQNVMQMFRITRLNNLFQITKDINTAEKILTGL